MDGRHATDDTDEQLASTESGLSETKGLDSSTRRRLLASTASLSALATAGCLGILGDGSETGPRPGEPTPYSETETDAGTPGSGSETPGETATPGGTESYAVEYVQQGATIDVLSDETLLDAGLDEDFDMPYQCQVGVCGQCASTVDGDGTELVEHGDVRYSDMDEQAFEEGYVLPCVASPRDEFSLTTGKQDELDSFLSDG